MKKKKVRPVEELKALSPAHNLALAILLWRGYHSELHNSGSVPSNASCEAAEMALDMARAQGVAKEYMDLMLSFPVMEVRVNTHVMTVKELEEWE